MRLMPGTLGLMAALAQTTAAEPVTFAFTGRVTLVSGAPAVVDRFAELGSPLTHLSTARSSSSLRHPRAPTLRASTRKRFSRRECRSADGSCGGRRASP
jgi:hypothetical protein